MKLFANIGARPANNRTEAERVRRREQLDGAIRAARALRGVRLRQAEATRRLVFLLRRELAKLE